MICQDEGDEETFGRYRGTVLRSQLLYILKSKAFKPQSDDAKPIQLSLKDFRESYPRYIPIEVSAEMINFTFPNLISSSPCD